METFTLLIIFKDGTKKSIKGVSDYEIMDNRVFAFVKNGYRSFLPVENVVFFGREFDYEN